MSREICENILNSARVYGRLFNRKFSEDTTSEDTTSEDTTSEDTTSEDTTSEDTTSEDTASEGYYASGEEIEMSIASFEQYEGGYFYENKKKAFQQVLRPLAGNAADGWNVADDCICDW